MASWLVHNQIERSDITMMMDSPRRNAIALAVLMCAAAVGGIAARPTVKAADRGEGISLEALVPRSFEGWTELPVQGAQVVNPQTKELLDKLYSQILTRTYIDKDGYRIMLSLAYGDDQRGALQAHKPEVCYPAQGFKLHTNDPGELATGFGSINVRRLSTSLGSRAEPVTYWFTVGNEVVQGKLERRLSEFRLGLTGQIPDGMLFRISSIDTDTARAFAKQQKFAAQLLASIPPGARKRLSGLGAE
jgi:EpsI family protein